MTLRLSTFGSVFLSRDGQILTGPAGQRRLLAILTVLSAVGERGISRDKLLGLLWSEGEPDKSRHALTQSLYHIRKALGVERIFLSGTDLRIDPSVLSSDVHDFQLAIAEGRHADAAHLYRGAFLDGFYLNGDPDFEFWVTSERDRFARGYRQALDSLARAARAAHDLHAEIEWRARLADQDPLNGVAVASLMTVLLESGDHAGAIQRGRVHTQRMREELDLPPASEVSALLATLKRPPAAQNGAEPASIEQPAAAPADAQSPTGPAISAPAMSVSERRAGARDRRKRDGRRRTLVGLTATFAVATAALSLSEWRMHSARAAANQPSIAVAPFRVDPGDASTAYVREGLLDLLAARIAVADGKRASDPSHVLRSARATGYLTDGSSAPGLADALRLGKELEADEIVTGVVEPAGVGSVRVSATLVDVAARRASGTVSVTGPADNLIELSDRIAAGLILPEAGEHLVQPEPPRVSPNALRDYVTGRAAYRRSDYSRAIVAFLAAVTEEPRFALAALGLAMAADKVNAAEQHDRGVAIAWAERSALPPSDRAFLRAFAGPRYPRPSSAAEVLEAWREVVRLAPDRADAWYELGESLYDDGEILGMRDAADQATVALERALRLDPAFTPARRMLSLLYARKHDLATLRRFASTTPASDTNDALSLFVRWRVAHALGDSAEVARVRQRFPDAPAGALRNIAMTAQFEGVGVKDGDSAIDVLSRRALTDAERVDVALARHSRALNREDRAGAAAIARELERFPAGLHIGFRLEALDALFSGADPASGKPAAESLAARLRMPARGAVADSAVRLADACVLGLWRASTGDLAGAREALALLGAGGAPAYPVPVGASASACADLIDASIAIATHAPQARQQLAHLDSLMLSGPAAGDAMRYANLVVARDYRAIGDARSALAALQRRSYGRGWPRYRETGLRLQIELAESLGDTATAHRARTRLESTSR